MRIASKLFLLTFVLVETLIVALGFAYHRQASSALLNAQSEYAHQLIQKSDEYLKLNMKYIQQFFVSASKDVRLQTKSYEEFAKWIKNNLVYYIPNTKNIHLIQNGNMLASTSLTSWTLLENNYFQDQLADMSEPSQIYWFGPYDSSVSQRTMTAAIQIPDGAGEPLVLALDIDVPQLYAALKPGSQLPMQGELLMLDRRNDPIEGNSKYTFYDVFERKFRLVGLDPALFDSGWTRTEATLDGRKLFLTRSANNLLGWQIIWVMDKTELLKPLDKLMALIVPLALLSVLLSMGIAWTISVFISRPIRKITASMDQVSAGQFDVSIRLARKDELGALAKHFNKMTFQIKVLIENLKATEERKKAADFVALQAQIRPHFLYNTLGTIGIFARKGLLDQVDLLISSLTEQLQYNLDASPKPVTLREELAAIESYVLLMSARYQGQFVLEKDIDPATLEFTIPKFILQPLVENSIFHGLVPLTGHGTLFIGSTIEAGGWELLIEDNGVGMDETKLAKLRSAMDSADADDGREESNGDNVVAGANGDKVHAGGSDCEVQARGRSIAGVHDEDKDRGKHNGRPGGIGIVNVHRRLRFMFGGAYAMRLTSREGAGTAIVIRLPAPTIAGKLRDGE